MDQLKDATPEEEVQLPNWICTFHRWMLSQGKKEGTAKAYASQMRLLYEDDGKGPSSMSTQEYFLLTKASYKNKLGNGQRSASIRLFIEFYNEHVASGGRLQQADNTKIYQVKPRAKSGPAQGTQKAQADAHGEEARQLRAHLDLPKDWVVVSRERSSGDLLVAVSPGGRAYNSRQAADQRLGRGTAPPSAPSKAADQRLGRGTAPPSAPSKVRPPREHRDPKETKEPSEPKEPTAEEITAALSGESVRRELPIQEALLIAIFTSNIANSGSLAGDGRRREAMFVGGRDISKNLTTRLHGLFLAEDRLSGGRPIFRKADTEKATYVYFNQEKGIWRFSHSLESRGDFAKVKDSADRPWQVTKSWKIFNGAKEYQEDPELKATVLGADSLPESVEVEVCLPVLPPGALAGMSFMASQLTTNLPAPAKQEAQPPKAQPPNKTPSLKVPSPDKNDSSSSDPPAKRPKIETRPTTLQTNLPEETETVEKTQAQQPKPEKTDPDKKGADKGSEKGSSGSSSGSDSRTSVTADKKVSGMRVAPSFETYMPPEGDMAAAKIAVRTGLRCACCYAVSCKLFQKTPTPTIVSV